MCEGHMQERGEMELDGEGERKRRGGEGRGGEGSRKRRGRLTGLAVNNRLNMNHYFSYRMEDITTTNTDCSNCFLVHELSGVNWSKAECVCIKQRES